MAATLAVLALPLAGCDRESAKTAPDLSADGRWRVVEIEGRKPAAKTMWIEVANGAVSGGFDGCNDWGFEVVDGKREIVSNAAGCVMSPDLAAYRAIVQTAPNASKPATVGDVLVLKTGASSLRAQKFAAE